MKTWIVLLKGINVGGRNKLPMKELTSELQSLGFVDVKTYIQSGNVVFRSHLSGSEIATVIGARIGDKFGFQPHLIIFSREELLIAARDNPFADVSGDEEGKLIHFFFLSEAPTKVDFERLERYRKSSERCQVINRVCYLHTPEGFGDSKLASQVEKVSGVVATARNLRTVQALLYLSADH